MHWSRSTLAALHIWNCKIGFTIFHWSDRICSGGSIYIVFIIQTQPPSPPSRGNVECKRGIAVSVFVIQTLCAHVWWNRKIQCHCQRTLMTMCVCVCVIRTPEHDKRTKLAGKDLSDFGCCDGGVSWQNRLTVDKSADVYPRKGEWRASFIFISELRSGKGRTTNT